MNTHTGQFAHRLATDRHAELHRSATERRMRPSSAEDESPTRRRHRTTRRVVVPALAGLLVLAGGITVQALADSEVPPAEQIHPPRGAVSRLPQAV